MNILKQIKDLIHEYPNDQMLGNKVRDKYKDKEIYEDQGDGHLIDSHLNELSQEDWICEYCDDSTYYVDLDYIGSKANHLGCELEHEMSYNTEIDLDRDMPC